MLPFGIRSMALGVCVAVVAGCAAPEVGPRLERGKRSRGSDDKTAYSSDEVVEGDETDTDSDPETSPAPEDDAADPGTPSTPSPEVVPEGSFAAGTMLLSLSDVNVRSGEGTNFDVLATIPGGTRVKVESTSGASGWVKVSFNGKVGYSSKPLLSLGKYSAARGKKMADRALALWNGKPSRDLCLAGVDDTAESAGAMPPGVAWLPRQPSAVAWQNYVLSNPQELLKRGYVRENLDANNIPKGAIIGWRAGQCGYHSQYGHIEIVADDASSRACSDYCGAVKKNCGAPLVFIPIE